MNEKGKSGDAPSSKKERQTPERKRGENAADSLPKEIRSKEIEEDVPPRRMVRTVDFPESEELQEAPYEKTERTTLEDRHPDWPKVNVTFYFARHKTAEDSRRVGEHMQGKQVYFYEAVYRSRDPQVPRGMLRLIASTSDTPSTEEFDEYLTHATFNGKQIEKTHFGPIMRALYKSGIVVGHADVQATDQDLLKLRTDFSYKLEESFDKTLSNQTNYLRKHARFQDEREKLMTARFEEELGRILEDNPELQERESINVLITMGSAHMDSIYNKFIASGITTERIIDQYPPLRRMQIVQELGEGKEPKKEDLARLYLSDMIHTVVLGNYRSAWENLSELDEYAERVSSYLSFEEIQTLHQQRCHGTGELGLWFNLHKKGLPNMPQTNEELSAAVDWLRRNDKNATT